MNGRKYLSKSLFTTTGDIWLKFLFGFLTIALAWVLDYLTNSQIFSAWEWPTLDQLPYIMRRLDPNFNLYDFFTNISVEPNPRKPYGEIFVILAQLFNLSGYNSMLIVKLICSFLLPFLLYNIFVFYFNEDKINNKWLLFIIIVLLISIGFHEPIKHTFSIAWWNLGFTLTPSLVSINLLFFGFYLSLTNNHKYIFVAFIAFLSIATIIHPVTSLLSLVFLFPFSYKRFGLHLSFSFFVVAIAIGFISSLLFAGGDTKTSGEDVFDAYIMLHKGHYYPNAWQPLWLSFKIINHRYQPILLVFGLMTIFTIIHWFFNTKFKYFIVYYLFTLSFALIIQIIAVYFWHNKTLLLFGISRYFIFSYPILVFTIISFLVKYIDLLKVKLSFSFKITIMASIFVITVFVVFFRISKLQGYPKLENSSKVVQFLEKNASDKSVIADLTNFYIKDLRLIAQRPVYVGAGYPFNLKYMKEHLRRYLLLFGDKIYKEEIVISSEVKIDHERVFNNLENEKVEYIISKAVVKNPYYFKIIDLDGTKIYKRHKP